ncbi:hypothetical protein QD460_30500 [Rhizobium jaguaris]|uniref:hypothetical protein n=1 Tax=Rhizobium jaguaris TaxID=1312183 RepID=UPI0039BFFEDC
MKQLILAIILIAVPVALFSGYEIYSTNTAQAASPGLGDLSNFKTIIADVQALAEKGDMLGAAKRITDFETAWDQAETAIRPLNQTQWGNVDTAADAALKAVRAPTPQVDKVKSMLANLMAELNDPNKAL